MKTIVTIAGTDYDGDGRAGAGFLGIDALRVSLDSPYGLDFHTIHCGPNPQFVVGQEVKVRTTDDDGSNVKARFTGDITRVQARTGGMGWEWAYTCAGLKARANRFPVTAPDGTPIYLANLPPGDLDGVGLALAVGKNVGQVVRAILEGGLVAARMHAAGIGGYAVDGFGALILPATLSSITLADLALLDIVPRSAVRLSGPSCFDGLEQFILGWHPQAAFWIDGAGIIRATPIFGQPSNPVVLTGDLGGDGLHDHLSYELNVDTCFTAVEITGMDIDIWYGSCRFLSLKPNWTLAQQNAWTSADFLVPSRSAFQGSITSLTSTSATVTADDPLASWPADSLQAVGATISLVATLLGAAVDVSQTRTIITCTALTPGGSATVTWDSSMPIDSTDYNKFRIESVDTGLGLVGRSFLIRDPSTGHLGTATYVGSHLVSRFPRSMWWNIANSQVAISMPAAKVQWSINGDGSPPYFEQAIRRVEINRDTGGIILSEPAVFKSATPDELARGYPTTELGGLYHDVFVALPFNKGQLLARAPSSGFAGKASAAPYNINRVLSIPVTNFVSAGDVPNLVKLAGEHLLTHQDPQVTGAVEYHGWLDTFDPLDLPYSLAISIGGIAPADFPLAGLDLPARTVTVVWPDTGPDLIALNWGFSNVRRQFTADDLYIHPSRLSGSVGAEGGGEGSVFGDASLAATQGYLASPIGGDNAPATPGAMADESARVMDGFRAGRTSKTPEASDRRIESEHAQQMKDARESKMEKTARLAKLDRTYPQAGPKRADMPRPEIPDPGIAGVDEPPVDPDRERREGGG